jgi:hypothetical protein
MSSALLKDLTIDETLRYIGENYRVNIVATPPIRIGL